jgi:hypothetical protein
MGTRKSERLPVVEGPTFFELEVCQKAGLPVEFSLADYSSFIVKLGKIRGQKWQTVRTLRGLVLRGPGAGNRFYGRYTASESGLFKLKQPARGH